MYNSISEIMQEFLNVCDFLEQYRINEEVLTISNDGNTRDIIKADALQFILYAVDEDAGIYEEHVKYINENLGYSFSKDDLYDIRREIFDKSSKQICVMLPYMIYF